MERGHTIKILDKGYVKFIDSMGGDEDVIEAARMSTGKSFHGWYWEEDTYADVICADCETQHLEDVLPTDEEDASLCTNCWSMRIYPIKTTPHLPVTPKLLGRKGHKRDLSLLEFLYMNKHATPFEMGELVIEVKAPLMVFREWHRHRTQSYNEMSGRYSKIPNEHYVHPLIRLEPKKSTNKQEASLVEVDPQLRGKLTHYRELIMEEQESIFHNYEEMLAAGIPKEVARTNCPLSRYSKMRAKTDIRNWLAFLTLRMPSNAMWEIRQYAYAVAEIIRAHWPKTFALFVEHDFFGVRFSRTEMRALRELILHHSSHVDGFEAGGAILSSYLSNEKERKRFMKKILHDNEEDYKDVPVLQDI